MVSETLLARDRNGGAPVSKIGISIYKRGFICVGVPARQPVCHLSDETNPPLIIPTASQIKIAVGRDVLQRGQLKH